MDARLEVEIGAKITELQTKIAEAAKSVSDFGISATGNIKKLESDSRGLLFKAKASLDTYRKAAENALNPNTLNLYNLKIQKAELEVQKLTNLGKVGFDSFGNAIKQSSGSVTALGTGLTKGLSALRTIAYVVPGIGIAGIFNLAFEALTPLVSKLFDFNTALADTHIKFKLLNEAISQGNVEAGKTITGLKVLYDAATNVANSDALRTRAAKELQKQFPETFKNESLQAIKLGELSDKYQQLTKDIIENARAAAIAKKLEDIAGKQLESDFQKRKILNAESNELSRVKGPIRALTGSTASGSAMGTSGANFTTISVNQLKNTIAQRAQAALAIQAINDATLQDQYDFLQKFVKQENLVNAFVKPVKAATEKAAKYIYDFKYEINSKPVFDIGLIKTNAEMFGSHFENITKKYQGVLLSKSDELTKEMAKNAQDSIVNFQFGILNSLQSGFDSFFENILTTGTLSFKKLGQSIIATFAQVLASAAAKKVIDLLLGIGTGGTANGTGTVLKFLGGLGHLLGFENGVNNFGGGLAMVGERGREVINLPRGSSVIPNNQLGGGSVQVFIANSFVRGTDTVTVYNRATNQSFRTTR